MGVASDADELLQMYAHFSPKGKFQGLPPEDKTGRAKWIQHLMSCASNFLALRKDKVIGHAAMIPDLRVRDSEYLVFVDQHYRGRGVGTELTRAAIDLARELGLELIWLSVDACNFIAIRLYRKFGFDFCDKGQLRTERKMVRSLHHERSSHY